MEREIQHTPVLLGRVMEFLKETEGDGAQRKIVDCTLGLGGYSEEILKTFPDARVYAMDRDLRAIEKSRVRLSEYASRFTALHGNFGGMEAVLKDFAPFDAFVFDLGVSNMQLTEAERGFSFQNDGPLDMRMNPDGPALTAEDVLGALPAGELEEIFRVYGEERHSRRIAAKVAEYRKEGRSLKTTGELVGLIREALPAPVQRKMGTHPARRVFQALRIHVNDELGELESGLAAAGKLASPGAAVIAVAYHSLEDRIVKRLFRAWEKEEKRGGVLTKHPVLPGSEEIEENNKARSAKLRAFRFSKISSKAQVFLN